MWDLTLFVIVYDDTHQYRIYPIRNYSKLDDLVTEILNDNSMSTVLHIGFESPSKNFCLSARPIPGRLYATSSCRFALLQDVQFSKRAVLNIDGIQIFELTNGFGKIFEESTTASRQSLTGTEGGSSSSEWMKFLEEHDSDLFDRAQNNGIVDRKSYLMHENVLDAEDRFNIGVLYYQFGINNRKPDNHQDLLANVPPWFLEREISSIDLPVRIVNVFTDIEIVTVSDIKLFQEEDLLHLKNFGRNSISQLIIALHKAVQEGFGNEDDVNLLETGDSTFIEDLLFAINSNKPNLALVLMKRLGIEEKSKSLVEIGDILSVTRERIRQLEAKGRENLCQQSGIIFNFIQYINHLRISLGTPLYWSTIESQSTWLKGMLQYQETFDFLFKKGWLNSLNLLEVDGLFILTTLSNEEWEDLISTCLLDIETRLIDGQDISSIEVACKAMLPESSSELRDLFWATLKATVFFTQDNRPIGITASYDSCVKAVLNDLKEPTHYKIIADIIHKCTGKNYSLNRINNSLQTLAVLFDHGVYGLGKHFELEEAIRSRIRTKCEMFVYSKPSERQFHSNEFLSLIKDVSDARELSSYNIDYILSQSNKLAYLGRHAWVRKSADDSNKLQRIEIHELITNILLDNGGPMKTAEIREKVKTHRGLNSSFQIFEKHPLIRLDMGLFGIDGRDNIFTPEEENQIMVGIARCLVTKKVGIHESELLALLKQEIDLAIDPGKIRAIMSAAMRSDIVSVSQGNRYLFLPEWSDKRRISIKEALRIVTKDNSVSLRVSTAHNTVKKLTGLSLPEKLILTNLEWLGYRRTDIPDEVRLKSELSE
jgi:hypothetical protein